LREQKTALGGNFFQKVFKKEATQFSNRTLLSYFHGFYLAENWVRKEVKYKNQKKQAILQPGYQVSTVKRTKNKTLAA